MLGRRTTRFALAIMLAITSIAVTANAQQRNTVPEPTQTMNLSDAQVFEIQGLLGAATRELQSLYVEVQSMREFLEKAIAENDPVRIARAVLALDASEKAFENTKRANQRDLLSLLNENQKEIVKNYVGKSTPASD
jgi:hypothetical protein